MPLYRFELVGGGAAILKCDGQIEQVARRLVENGFIVGFPERPRSREPAQEGDE